MRLRRETGDFSVTFTADVTSVTIRTDLRAEDLIGLIINNNGVLYAVVGVSESNGAFILATFNNIYTYTYTPSTGAVTVAFTSDTVLH